MKNSSLTINDCETIIESLKYSKIKLKEYDNKVIIRDYYVLKLNHLNEIIEKMNSIKKELNKK